MPIESYHHEHHAAESKQESFQNAEKMVSKDIADTQNHLDEKAERMAQVKNMLAKFEKLAERKWIKGFEAFETFILQASQEHQEQFLDRGNVTIIKQKSLEAKMFPINEFELSSILVGKSLQEDVMQKEASSREREALSWRKEELSLRKQEEFQNEIQEAKRTKQQILNLKESLAGIQLSDDRLAWLLLQIKELPDVVTTDKQIEKIQQINELSKEIVNRLSKTQEIEKTILPQAKAQWRLKQVTDALVKLDSKFKARIDAWRLWEAYPNRTDLPPEQQSRIQVALWERSVEAEKSGNIFTVESDDNFQVDYDVVNQERRLSVDGYSLESNVPQTADYQEPKLAYTKVEQQHLPKIQTIEKISQALQNKWVSVDELAEIQATIKSIPWASDLWINFSQMQSGKQIQSALKEKLVQAQQKIQEARNTYQKALGHIRNSQLGKLKEKDKKTKETLNFLKSIGFTKIPQWLTDRIIETINIHPKQYGFQEEINFSQGQLGMDKNVGESWVLDLADKQAFAKFINKMIGITDEDGNPPINVSALASGNAPVGDTIKFQALLAKSGLMKIGGVEIALDNLSKTEQ